MTLAEWAVKYEHDLIAVPGALLVRGVTAGTTMGMELVTLDDMETVLFDNGVYRLVPRPAEKGCC